MRMWSARMTAFWRKASVQGSGVSGTRAAPAGLELAAGSMLYEAGNVARLQDRFKLGGK